MIVSLTRPWALDLLLFEQLTLSWVKRRLKFPFFWWQPNHSLDRDKDDCEGSKGRQYFLDGPYSSSSAVASSSSALPSSVHDRLSSSYSSSAAASSSSVHQQLMMSQGNPSQYHHSNRRESFLYRSDAEGVLFESSPKSISRHSSIGSGDL